MKIYINILYKNIYYILGLFILLFIGIVFKSDFFALISSILGIITTILLAKGKPSSYIMYVLCNLIYIYVSYINKYYGEVILYSFLITPLCIFSFINWIKNKNVKTNSVEVNRIKKFEIIILLFVSIPIFFVTYALLKKFNTEQLVISSLSVFLILLATYLHLRRSKSGFYFYALSDIILLVMWLIPIFNGNFSLFPLTINNTINFIVDSYGIYNWKKLENKQK